MILHYGLLGENEVEKTQESHESVGSRDERDKVGIKGNRRGAKTSPRQT